MNARNYCVVILAVSLGQGCCLVLRIHIDTDGLIGSDANITCRYSVSSIDEQIRGLSLLDADNSEVQYYKYNPGLSYQPTKGPAFHNRTSIQATAHSSTQVVMLISDLRCSDAKKYKCIVQYTKDRAKAPPKSATKTLEIKIPPASPTLSTDPVNVRRMLAHSKATVKCSATVGTPGIGRVIWSVYSNQTLIKSGVRGHDKRVPLLPTDHPCDKRVESTLTVIVEPGLHALAVACFMVNKNFKLGQMSSLNCHQPHNNMCAITEIINSHSAIEKVVVTEESYSSHLHAGGTATLLCVPQLFPDLPTTYRIEYQWCKKEDPEKLKSNLVVGPNDTLTITNLGNDSFGTYVCTVSLYVNGRSFSKTGEMRFEISLCFPGLTLIVNVSFLESNVQCQGSVLCAWTNTCPHLGWAWMLTTTSGYIYKCSSEFGLITGNPHPRGHVTHTNMSRSSGFIYLHINQADCSDIVNYTCTLRYERFRQPYAEVKDTKILNMTVPPSIPEIIRSFPVRGQLIHGVEEAMPVKYVCSFIANHNEGMILAWGVYQGKRMINIPDKAVSNFYKVSLLPTDPKCAERWNSEISFKITRHEFGSKLICYLKKSVNISQDLRQCDSDDSKYCTETDTLIVHYGVSDDTMVLAREPLILYKNGSLILTCKGVGHPAPTYAWTKDLEDITKQSFPHEGGSQIILRKAGLHDSGLYTCHATNNVLGRGVTAQVSLLINVYEEENISTPSFPSQMADVRPIELVLTVSGVLTIIFLLIGTAIFLMAQKPSL